MSRIWLYSHSRLASSPQRGLHMSLQKKVTTTTTSKHQLLWILHGPPLLGFQQYRRYWKNYYRSTNLLDNYITTALNLKTTSLHCKAVSSVALQPLILFTLNSEKSITSIPEEYTCS